MYGSTNGKTTVKIVLLLAGRTGVGRLLPPKVEAARLGTRSLSVIPPRKL